MNRCLKDVFAYCTGKPDKITTETTYQYRGFSREPTEQPLTITTCRLDPLTCGKCHHWIKQQQAFMQEYCGRGYQTPT